MIDEPRQGRKTGRYARGGSNVSQGSSLSDRDWRRADQRALSEVFTGADEFTTAEIVPARTSGARRWPVRAGRRLRQAAALLGPSAFRRRKLVKRIQTPLDGARRIAVISRKGGVGKTTTTLMLGHTFAAYRDDRIIALDGNPDAGSLTYRVPRETANNILDLLTAPHAISSYGDLRAFTNRTTSRLEVLAAAEDPRISESLGERDYRRVAELLDQHYRLTCMDTGTGMIESQERGIFDLADQVVLVMGPTIDSARTAASTFDWLEQNGYRDLVRGGIAAVNSARRGSGELQRIERHFRARCRGVIQIPWDPHLETGAEAALDELRPATQSAYMRLAAALSDQFGPEA